MTINGAGQTVNVTFTAMAGGGTPAAPSPTWPSDGDAVAAGVAGLIVVALAAFLLWNRRRPRPRVPAPTSTLRGGGSPRPPPSPPLPPPT